MTTKKRFLILSTFLVGMVVVLALTAGTAAAEETVLSVPGDYESCSPSQDTVELSGIPAGVEAKIDVYRFFPDNSSTLVGSTDKVTPAGDTLALTVTYPPLAEWDFDPNTGDRSITHAAFAEVHDTDPPTKFSEKWTITCKGEEPTPTPTPTKTATPTPTPTKTPTPTPTKTPTPTPTPTKTPTPTPTPTKTPTPTPTPSGGEGCTPGYWRQDHHFDSWVGYAPSDSYNGTFGVDGSFETLLDAVWAQGGGENALARHAVAALLNAVSPDVSYLYSESEVISMVQAAYASGEFEATKNLFEAQNEAGCPLD